MNRLGADISFWVDDNSTPQMTDFNKMRNAGVEFLFIRAGQNLWQDSDFARNWEDSKGILPRGAYWFYDDRIEPSLQAELFYETLKATGDFGELPLVIDYEKTPKAEGQPEEGPFLAWRYLRIMIEKVQEHMPEKKIIIYTGRYFWLEHGPSSVFSPLALEWFKQFDLWMAAYNSRPIEEQIFPKPWDKLFIWQFTGNGDGPKYGIESLSIDLNYFNGSDEEWEDFIGNWVEIPPDDGDSDKIYDGTVVSPYGVNFLSGAGSQYPKISDAKPEGTSLLADEVVPVGSDEWLHVIEINGITADGWMASIWNGETLISYSEVSPPTPPDTSDIEKVVVHFESGVTEELWPQE